MQWVSFPGLGIGKIFFYDYIFKFGDFKITVYSIIFGLAMVAGAMFGFFMSEKFGVLKSKYVNIVIFGSLFGIFGARVYYIVFNSSRFFSHSSFIKNFVEIINFKGGGLAVYGGIIFSIAAGAVVCIIENVKMLPVLDLAGMGFFLGQSIGRWGNFFNVEAFGSKTNLPWGMVGSNISQEFSPAHPTFFYESIWCFFGFLFLNFLKNRRRFDGELFLVYLILYGFERFFVEGLRVDSLMLFETQIRVSQLLSLILFFGSLVCLIFCLLKTRNGSSKLYVQTADWKNELRLSKI